jgi:hypothetical protein
VLASVLVVDDLQRRAATEHAIGIVAAFDVQQPVDIRTVVRVAPVVQLRVGDV